MVRNLSLYQVCSEYLYFNNLKIISIVVKDVKYHANLSHHNLYHGEPSLDEQIFRTKLMFEDGHNIETLFKGI